ncbi:MAG: substrate-binding domain-containing protein [Gammaproteobacteria bacterium]|nr:substrate-binding domain-containing protein [Gammaproteobacteria bacterium]
MLNLKIFYSLFLIFIFPINVSAQNIKIIAFAQDSMANDFRQAQVFEVRDALESNPDVKFIFADAKGQTSLMISQIEKFIASNVDLIIVGTNDDKAVVPVIAKAYQSGIPVIILDRGIKSKKYSTFINSDNIKIGKIGAEYIADQLDGKGKILLFEGIQTADVTQLRTKGFMDEISKYKNIEVIKRTGNYLRRDTIIEMEQLIADGINVDAVFAHSDSMISGVRSVLLRHNVDLGSVITIGCDYTSEAQKAIRTGKQTGSVKFPLGGKQSAEIALKILSGEQVPYHISIPVKLVTKENVDEVEPIF